MPTATVTRDQRRQQLNRETLFALADMADQAGIPDADLLGFSDLVEALLDRPPVPAGPAPTGGRRFSKPQPARHLEARARARTLGVRVEVVSEARQYRTRSQSNPGEVYTIARTPAGWACSCLGFYHTGCCKHLGQVERRAAREGWAFGIICPLSKAPAHFPLETDQPPAPVSLEDSRARRRAALTDLYGDAA